MRIRGFTLIEMLLSLGIFAVITAGVLANYRAGRNGDELRIASQLLAGELRRAQTMAVSGRTANWCVGGANNGKLCPNGASSCPSGACSTDVPKGYGVRLTTASAGAARMTLFVDIDGDRVMDAGEDMTTTPIVSTAQVNVTSLSPVSSGTLDVVYAPPKPTTWLNAANSGATAAIVLTHRVSGQTRTINVNSLTGQVSTN